MAENMYSNGNVFYLCTDIILARKINMVIVTATILYSLVTDWTFFHGSLQYS